MTTGKTEAEVRRCFTAAPETVFAAFAEPGLIALWLSPSPEITLTLLQFDFRVGGHYHFAYRLPAGERRLSLAAPMERSNGPQRLCFHGP